MGIKRIMGGVKLIPDWTKGIDRIITYLIENPFEMIYDPADDLLSESFELDKYIAFKFNDQNYMTNKAGTLHYMEFDRGHATHQLKECNIENEKKIIQKIIVQVSNSGIRGENLLTPFYARVLRIDYNFYQGSDHLLLYCMQTNYGD